MPRVRLAWMMMVVCFTVLAPSTGRSQTWEEEAGITGPLVIWNFGGTLGVPIGSAADRVDVGGGFAVGVTLNPSPVGGVQFEYGINWSSLDTDALASAGISGSALLQYFNLNGVLRPFRTGRTGLYLVGGGGLYYRSADITQFEGTVAAPYCDPWLYFCSVVPVSASSVVAFRDTWDWGLDAGVGLTFAVAPAVRLYFEVRYHYIFGPSFTDSTGNERSADGQFLPFTLGVRF
jgi:opacity protein-like surface antigen